VDLQTDSIYSNIEFVEDRPFNDFRYSINSEKLKILGWREVIDFEDGLKTLI
jgi:dTDP-glucose 4,6-dehydratase